MTITRTSSATPAQDALAAGQHNASVSAGDVAARVDASPAHAASGVSRRSILMNTIVSTASLASATALADPALSAEPADGGDRQAVVSRAEQMVELLRDRFVCAGWHERFDEQRAATFIDAVRREDWSSDDDPASPIVSSWMRDHGQSFDWLYDGNPVSLICGAAMQSPNAAAIPTGNDPIFAAIEYHRKALKALSGVINEKGEAEKRWLDEGNTLVPSVLLSTRQQWENYFEARQESPPFSWPFDGLDELRIEQGRTINKLFASNDDLRKKVRADLLAIKRRFRTTFGPIEARVDAGYDVESAARQGLASTVPTTAAGVAALMDYVQQEEDKNWGCFFDEEQQATLYSSLAKAARNLESDRRAAA